MENAIAYVLLSVLLVSAFFVLGCTKTEAAGQDVSTYDISAGANIFDQSAGAADTLDSDLEIPDLDLNLSID